MSWHNKIIWSEGLFVRTQHFQQHDRYIENLIESRCGSLRPFNWGLTALEIDRNLLSLGKFALNVCSGIMPDGSPVSLPDKAKLPVPLEVSAKVFNQIVYLALPLQRPGLAEVDSGSGSDDLARYEPQELEVVDNNSGRTASAKIQVGQLRLRLTLESEQRSEFACLAIARIQEASPDKGVILDDTFIPTCLQCSAAPKMADMVKRLQALLHDRGERLAPVVSGTSSGGVGEISHFMILQLVNRLEPLVTHFSKLPDLHPETFYRLCVQIAGELSTFARQEKRPMPLPDYWHDNLETTFHPLMQELQNLLGTDVELPAISIPWEEHKYNVRVARVADISLFKTANFILAVKADVQAEVIQRQFPAQVKIGPASYIRQLVNSGIPGIGLNLLPAVPRQIPFHTGFTYFEFDRNSRYWEGLDQTGAFALHVAGEFPNLQLELWAIKG